jgi:glycosyltransferase involved in cell wall biosynthesis
MERYLKRCLNSIIIPEILDKIEVIIVNDGSTDNSLSIAKSYANKYPHSMIVIDKQNGNYGSCINVALKIATGKYFKILDADDWFDSDSFAQLINKIQNVDVDMILTNFSREKRNGTSQVIVKNTTNIVDNFAYEFRKYDFRKNKFTDLLSMHSIAYKTILLKQINYIQTEGISYTDTEYCFYPLEYVKDFIFFDIVLYRYYIGREGQTISELSLIKNKNNLYKILARMIEYFSFQNKNITDIREQQCIVFERLLRYYYRTILVFCTKNQEDKNKLIKIDSFVQKFDSRIYERMFNFKYYNIPYINLWREKGKYCTEIRWFQFFKKIINLKTFINAQIYTYL